MALLDRVQAARHPARSTIDQYIAEYVLPYFAFNGHQYGIGQLPQQTMVDARVREIANTIPAYAALLRVCPPAFAAEMVRSLVISQARFTFRRRPWVQSRPRAHFGNASLQLLETPWPNGTTADLLAHMEWHAGLAGNAYVTNRTPGRLRLLRPDWVQILYGSKSEPDEAAYALDGEVVAYIYTPGGPTSTSRGAQPVTLLPYEVAHWAPLPDPEGVGIGMSWLTPGLRDMQVDRATTDHKLAFFQNGATPNMVVKGLKSTTQQQFDEMVDSLEADHGGVRNAYRTLYLSEGADATVVGSNFTDMALRALQDGGEARIAVLSRVPAAMLGISEGLRGSALNESSFAMARRVFADTWLTPNLQNLAASLAPMVDVPVGSELWFDTTDIPIMREDAQDATNIEQVKQTTIVGYVNAGFTAKSAIAAVDAQDITLLEHTDLLSVQLQPPGATVPGEAGAGDSAPPADAASPPAEQPPQKAAARAFVPMGFAPSTTTVPNQVRYSDDQPRDDHGRWSDGGDGAAALVKETLAQGGTSAKIGPKGRLIHPTTGFMVSVPGGITPSVADMTSPGGTAILRSFIDDHAAEIAKDNVYLGLWHDEAHGEIAIDVSYNIQDRAEAIALGVKNDQQAIYDVQAGDVIDTGGTGGRSEAAGSRLRQAPVELGRHDRRREGRLDPGRPRKPARDRRGLRYSDDQPRDDHGRWTSGGGDSADSPATPPLATASTDLPAGWRFDYTSGVYTSADGHTTIRDDQNKYVPLAVVDTVADLETRFPVTAEHIDVHMVTSLPDTIGGTTTYNQGHPDGTYTIDLNANLWTDNSVADAWQAAAENGNLMPSSIGDPATYCIVHEYGHVLDNSGGTDAAPLPYGMYVPTNVQERTFTAANELSNDERRATLADMSKYATAEPAEGMAEGFAEWAETNGKTDNRWAKLVAQAMGLTK